MTKNIDLRGDFSADPARREVLKKSLILLDDELANGELSQGEYEREKSRYLSYGSGLLIDQVRNDLLSVSDVPAVKGREHPQIRKASLWIGLVLAVAIMTIIALTSAKSPRPAGSPVSGSVALSNADILAQANAAQQQGDFASALKSYDKVIKADPNNLEALSSKGWTLYLASAAVGTNTKIDPSTFINQALTSLNKAVAVNPSYGPARAWRGIVLFRAKGDSANAVADFDAYLASAPANDPMRSLVQSARDQAAGSVK